MALGKCFIELQQRAADMGFSDFWIEPGTSKLYAHAPKAHMEDDLVLITNEYLDRLRMVKPLNLPSTEILKSAFQTWLTTYEIHDTERWKQLRWTECVILADVQFDEFLKILTDEITVREKALGVQ